MNYGTLGALPMPRSSEHRFGSLEEPDGGETEYEKGRSTNCREAPAALSHSEDQRNGQTHDDYLRDLDPDVERELRCSPKTGQVAKV